MLQIVDVTRKWIFSIFMFLISNNCALISVNCVSIKSQTSFGDVVTLHRKVDSDVSAVCADAGDDADGVVIDGTPFVLGSRHAPLHAHPIADLIKSNFLNSDTKNEKPKYTQI